MRQLIVGLLNDQIVELNYGIDQRFNKTAAGPKIW